MAVRCARIDEEMAENMHDSENGLKSGQFKVIMEFVCGGDVLILLFCPLAKTLLNLPTFGIIDNNSATQTKNNSST